MPGDTPPVDAQVDVGPRSSTKCERGVSQRHAPLKLGRFYPSQLLHADAAPGPMFRVMKLNADSFVAISAIRAGPYFQHRQRKAMSRPSRSAGGTVAGNGAHGNADADATISRGGCVCTRGRISRYRVSTPWPEKSPTSTLFARAASRPVSHGAARERTGARPDGGWRSHLPDTVHRCGLGHECRRTGRQSSLPSASCMIEC